MYATPNSASISALYISSIHALRMPSDSQTSSAPTESLWAVFPVSSPWLFVNFSHLGSGHVCMSVFSFLLFVFLFCSWFSKWFLKDLASVFPVYLNVDFGLWRSDPLVRPRPAFTFPFCPQGGCVRRCLHYSLHYSAGGTTPSCVNRATKTVKGKKLNRKGRCDQFLPQTVSLISALPLWATKGSGEGNSGEVKWGNELHNTSTTYMLQNKTQAQSSQSITQAYEQQLGVAKVQKQLQASL